ncbi:MAG: helix-turn-helix transcriptional regulator [Pseudomonadota bacterium]|nr:helix-turn-helix transcriptional regulator [Pseudomonadota bacterium]
MARHPQDPDLLRRLGDRLRTLREAAGLTQAKLADLLKMKPATISLFETGALSPTISTAASLAGALHVPLSELFVFAAHPDSVSDDEAALLAAYRKRTEEERALVRMLLRVLDR